MALINGLMGGIGPLMNEILMLCIIFAYIGVGLWAVTSIAPKPKGLGLNLFSGKGKGRSRGRRSRGRYK